MNHAQRQPTLVEHPPLLCAHCGAAQARSLVLAHPPTPTVCLSCGGAVVLKGPIWLEQMSELSPEAHALSVIRLALQQSRPPAQASRLHA
jgi:tRNA G26 N,N-dimethylase Trm1